MSSPFKDIIASDLDAVWFSELEEFWADHEVNGKIIRVIVDNDELIRRTAKRVYTGSDSGLYTGHKLLMLQAADYGPRPAIGNLVSFDGRKYRVAETDTQDGLLIIELEANRS